MVEYYIMLYFVLIKFWNKKEVFLILQQKRSLILWEDAKYLQYK